MDFHRDITGRIQEMAGWNRAQDSPKWDPFGSRAPTVSIPTLRDEKFLNHGFHGFTRIKIFTTVWKFPLQKPHHHHDVNSLLSAIIRGIRGIRGQTPEFSDDIFPGVGVLLYTEIAL